MRLAIGPPTVVQDEANKADDKLAQYGRIDGYDETFDNFTQEQLDRPNALARQAWTQRQNLPALRGDAAAKYINAILEKALGRPPRRMPGWEWPYQNEITTGSEIDGHRTSEEQFGSPGITVSKEQDLVASDILIGELLESGAAESFEVKAMRMAAWGILPWSHITTEYIRVVTKDGTFIFEGSTDVLYSASRETEIEYKPYTLIAAYPANTSPAAAVDHFKSFHTVDNDLARARSIENELTFALHLLPTGAAIDQAREGQYGEAAISGVADALLLAGSLARAVRATAEARKIVLSSQQLAKLTTIERRIAIAESVLNHSVGGYRVGQSYYNFTNKDGSKAEGAGQAADALLRLFSGTLSTRALAKKPNLPRASASSKATSGVGAGLLADDFHFSHNRHYELNPKHGPEPKTVRGKYIGKRPTNPETTLQGSLALGGNSQKRRIGYDPDTAEISIFDRDRDWWDRMDDGDPIQIGGIWHGHVRPWDQLNLQMKKTLIDAGMFDHKGNYIGGE